MKKNSFLCPFCFEYNSSKSLSALIQELVQQAEYRHEINPRAYHLKAMIQHLIGVHLEMWLTKQNFIIRHHKVIRTDRPTRRIGDFLFNRTAIHITTWPNLLLMEKCKTNLNCGYFPIIITPSKKAYAAQIFAECAEIQEQIDIIPAETFLVTALQELSNLSAEKRMATIQQVITRYNAIIDKYETDSSLKILFK